jgi:hypothetical protein
MILTLSIDWEGPVSSTGVISRMIDEGKAPEYGGHDYGLYQIYGRHILSGPGTLLYIGRATEQTFATRFRQHAEWLRLEEEVQIHVGRLNMPERYRPKDNWGSWTSDVDIVECAMIHKYSPNYNSLSVSNAPSLAGYERVTVTHLGSRGRIEEQDRFPEDWL